MVSLTRQLAAATEGIIKGQEAFDKYRANQIKMNALNRRLDIQQKKEERIAEQFAVTAELKERGLDIRQQEIERLIGKEKDSDPLERAAKFSLFAQRAQASGLVPIGEDGTQQLKALAKKLNVDLTLAKPTQEPGEGAAVEPGTSAQDQSQIDAVLAELAGIGEESDKKKAAKKRKKQKDFDAQLDDIMDLDLGM